MDLKGRQEYLCLCWCFARFGRRVNLSGACKATPQRSTQEIIVIESLENMICHLTSKCCRSRKMLALIRMLSPNKLLRKSYVSLWKISPEVFPDNSHSAIKNNNSRWLLPYCQSLSKRITFLCQIRITSPLAANLQWHWLLACIQSQWRICVSTHSLLVLILSPCLQSWIQSCWVLLNVRKY